jgi:hypothetical protein
VFEGSLTGVVREDADIGTSVMTIKAHDGDKEHTRKIVYELVESELFVRYVIMCTCFVLFAQSALNECIMGRLCSISTAHEPTLMEISIGMVSAVKLAK